MTYRECGLGYEDDESVGNNGEDGDNEDDGGVSGQYQRLPPFGGTVSSFSKLPQNGQTGQLKSVR